MKVIRCIILKIPAECDKQVSKATTHTTSVEKYWCSIARFFVSTLKSIFIVS